MQKKILGLLIFALLLNASACSCSLRKSNSDENNIESSDDASVSDSENSKDSDGSNSEGLGPDGNPSDPNYKTAEDGSIGEASNGGQGTPSKESIAGSYSANILASLPADQRNNLKPEQLQKIKNNPTISLNLNASNGGSFSAGAFNKSGAVSYSYNNGGITISAAGYTAYGEVRGNSIVVSVDNVTLVFSKSG